MPSASREGDCEIRRKMHPTPASVSLIDLNGKFNLGEHVSPVGCENCVWTYVTHVTRIDFPVLARDRIDIER